jgi:hypothetical protein
VGNNPQNGILIYIYTYMDMEREGSAGTSSVPRWWKDAPRLLRGQHSSPPIQVEVERKFARVSPRAARQPPHSDGDISIMWHGHSYSNRVARMIIRNGVYRGKRTGQQWYATYKSGPVVGRSRSSPTRATGC